MRRTVPFIFAALVLPAAPAAAQTASSATPNAAGGKPATLRFSLDATQPPVNGLVPNTLSVTAPGFTIDRRAVSHRCTQGEAKLNECPKGSRIGSGNLVLHVVLPDGKERDAKPTLDMYLGTGSKVLAVAFVAGYRVVPATMSTSGGVTLTFNPLPAPPAFPGVGYALRSVTLTMGAKRTVKRYRTRTVRRNGRKHRVRRLVSTRRFSLLHTPATCPGSWPSTMQLGFPAAAPTTIVMPTACTS